MHLGDEATCINDSWMFLLWTSDFSPFLTDALGSRMVMCLLPAKHYVVTEDGVNMTLQVVMHAITESWKRLSRTGIPVHDFASRGGAEATLSERENIFCFRFHVILLSTIRAYFIIYSSSMKYNVYTTHGINPGLPSPRLRCRLSGGLEGYEAGLQL